MKKYFIIFVLIFPLILNAQDEGKMKNKKGSISGIVMDKTLQKPLDQATVQAFKVKDSSLVSGTYSNSKGEFSISDISMGRYYVKIAFVGYNTAIVSGIRLTPEATDIKLETVQLDPGGQSTTEIQVTAEKNYFEAGMDKKVYNVEKDLTAQNGSALEALQNIPSVTVDIDGNVSLRGSGNLKIMINGKPSNYSGSISTILEQIPANTIESIEIITNPSSKYDPEGTAGIINIVIKKETNLGYNLVLGLSAGTGDKYSGNFNYSIKKEKYILSVNYGLRSMINTGFGNSFRTTLNNSTTTYLEQNSEGRMKMLGNMAGLGFDYDFDKKNSISLSSSFHFPDRTRTDVSFYNNMNSAFNPIYSYSRNNIESETGHGWDANISYKKKFDKPKQELTASVLSSGHIEDEDQDITQANSGSLPYREKNTTNDRNYLWVLQSDYTHPFSEDSKMELGFKSSISRVNSDYNVEILDTVQNIWASIPALKDNFIYDSKVNAVYGTYGAKFGSFSFLAGLRLEYTFTKASQITQSAEYSKDYFSYFPSLYLTQNVTKTTDLQLSYTRRINRPNMRFIDPFVDRSDPLNLRYGNPELNPEYINSFELGFIKYFNTVALTSSVFYKRTTDVINRFTTLSDSVTYTTFQNIGKANSYGVEFVLTGDVLKWWILNANFSYFNTEVIGGDAELNNNSYSWSGRINSNMFIPDLFDVQLSYNYTGKNVTLQGYMNPTQSFDLALKKDFFDKKLSLGFRISDIFNQQRFSNYTEGTNFTQEMTRRRTSRNAFLTLTFRFGNTDKGFTKKKKKDDTETEPTDEY
jgi:outer membrane receptor protein involved in Fe transport